LLSGESPMNTVEYVKYWAKLHDVHLYIEGSESGSYATVSFNEQCISLAPYYDKEYTQAALYDMVYGVRGDVCPDTVRPEEVF
jgi:hypothetical protein